MSCQTGLTDCSGKCVNLQTDYNNCGKCAGSCKAGEVCSAGACKVSCQTGLTNCSGKCVSLMNNYSHCGACATACKTGEVCVAGKCYVLCGSGLTNCSGKCVNTQTDVSNCGKCGTKCTVASNCTGGLCVSIESCAKILASNPLAKSGVYSIKPKSVTKAFSVYCEMTKDGGGWTLLFASPANNVPYGSGFDGWWKAGNTTALTSPTGTGKSLAYDSVPFAEIRLTATLPNVSSVVAKVGKTISAMVTLPGTEITSCSGLTYKARHQYTATSRTGSYFPNNYIAIVSCDGDGSSLEASGGNYDAAIFSANYNHGDYNYANGDIGSEFRVGGQYGSTAAGSSNRLAVWVR